MGQDRPDFFSACPVLPESLADGIREATIDNDSDNSDSKSWSSEKPCHAGLRKELWALVSRSMCGLRKELWALVSRSRCGPDPVHGAIEGLQQEISDPPSSETGAPWLAQPGLSEIERRSRLLVLHQVCDALLALPLHQRPRSLAAFTNFTKHSRRIRCFSVAPLSLCLRLENVPEGLISLVSSRDRPKIIPAELLEEPSGEVIRNVRSKWERLDKDSWSKNFKMHAKWLETAAHVVRVYSAQEVITALIDLGVLSSTSYGQDLLDIQVSKSLPVKEFVPEVPWSQFVPVRRHTCHTVTMPPSCSGKFIGTGGATCRALTLQLQEHADQTDVYSAPRVQLNLRLPNGKRNHGMVELHIRWSQWESPVDARPASMKVAAMAKDLHQVVIQQVNEIYARRLTMLANRRSKRAEMFQEAGRAYHENKRHARRIRINAKDDSACRGLELPPPGISKKRGNPSLNRKDVGKQRRRALLWEKRKTALQACCALGLSQAPSFQESTDAQIRQASKDVASKCSINGPARQMLKHLSSCSDESAMMALGRLACVRKAADRPVNQPKHRRQNQSRQQKRMMHVRTQTESAAESESAEPQWAAEAEWAAEKHLAQEKMIMDRTLGLFITNVNDCRRRHAL